MDRTAERHPGPALSWIAALAAALVLDAALGRWVALPIFVMGFYGGMVVIDLVTYPMLRRWRNWLRSRGVRAWYLVEVGVLWAGTAAAAILLAPVWLRWDWEGLVALRVVGALVLAASVAVGAWAAWNMGWARLLLAPALFPSGEQERGVPQRLVVWGPYRYVRNPLYDMDVAVIAGAALLTGSAALLVLAGVYLIQLGMQLHLEERELRERFGETYERYCRLVPRFVPRLTPVDPEEIHGSKR